MYIIHTSSQLDNLTFFPETKDLLENLKLDEYKLEYNLEKSLVNEIYNSVKVYTSDCCGLGKSYLIKKEIKERGEDYYYFGIGDNLLKDEIFKKLKKFLKHEVKGKIRLEFI